MLGVKHREDRMRQKCARALEAFVVSGVRRLCDIGHRERWGAASIERLDDVRHIPLTHRFIESDANVGVAHPPEIDTRFQSSANNFVTAATLEVNAHRIKKVIMHHCMPQTLSSICEGNGVRVHAPGNAGQARRPVPYCIRARNDCQKYLSRANVARCLLAPDVLLPGAQRHAHRHAAACITRHPNQSARHQTLVLVLCGKETGVRTTKSHGYAKALRVTYRHVGSPFARRSKERQRKEVGSRYHQRVSGVRTLSYFAVVVNRTVGCWILKQDRKDVAPKRCTAGVPNNQIYTRRPGARLYDVDGLRVTSLVHKDRLFPLLTLHSIRKMHPLSSRCPLVEHRRVGDLHPRQLHHHRLIVQERFHSPLRNLRLIWRIRGVPARIFQNVALNNRGHERTIVTHAYVGPSYDVL